MTKRSSAEELGVRGVDADTLMTLTRKPEGIARNVARKDGGRPDAGVPCQRPTARGVAGERKRRPGWNRDTRVRTGRTPTRSDDERGRVTAVQRRPNATTTGGAQWL
jgi:hypothetical protein